MKQQRVLQYKKLFFEENGIDLSLEEAEEQASRLVKLVKAVVQPMPVSLLEKYLEIKAKTIIKNSDTI